MAITVDQKYVQGVGLAGAESDGIQLPYVAPLAWWTNKRSNNKDDGVDYFGGWAMKLDDYDAGVREYGVLPNWYDDGDGGIRIGQTAAQLLQPMADVYAIAHHGIIYPLRRADIADNDRAGMQADTQMQRRLAGFRLDFVAGLDRRTDGKCGAAGTDGMVGLFFWRAPKGHHRIADILINCAALRVDAGAHLGEMIIQQGRRFFRAHLLRSGREANDIREHDRDVALHRAPEITFPLVHEAAYQTARHIGFEPAQGGDHGVEGLARVIHFPDPAGG